MQLGEDIEERYAEKEWQAWAAEGYEANAAAARLAAAACSREASGQNSWHRACLLYTSPSPRD
eukprot:13080016-Alexandrium_andersonii.AAC.1